jgi:hypothetical protein
VGGAAPAPAAAASAWLLFFPPAFDVFDGDGFILQEQGVFTRIRSGATLQLSGGDALSGGDGFIHRHCCFHQD